MFELWSSNSSFIIHSGAALLSKNINSPEPECKSYVFGKTLVWGVYRGERDSGPIPEPPPALAPMPGPFSQQ